MIDKYTGERKQPEFEEKVLEINRISRTVKGGRRIRFRALVIIGNKKGRVGFGVAKASEVVTAINKAKEYAVKHTVDIPIVNGTIPYQITSSFGSSKILLKPAREGTSLIAGGSIRNFLEIAGIKNIVTKSLGSNNKINVVTATFKAVSSFKQMPAYTNPKNNNSEKEIEKSVVEEEKTEKAVMTTKKTATKEVNKKTKVAAKETKSTKDKKEATK